MTKRRRVSKPKFSHVDHGDDDEPDTQESRTAAQSSVSEVDDANQPISESDLKLSSNIDAVDDVARGNAFRSTTTKTTTSVGTAPSKNRADGCLQTPHTMRLLKLIREGSQEYASMAVERLAFTCTSSTSPMQLWDLLGRLQAFLSAPEWSTRQIAAQAIYVVAHHLPVEDQYQFLASTSGFHRDGNGEEKIVANDDMCHEYLTVKDLLQQNDTRWGPGRSGMDAVLAEGKELFALDESRYTSTGGHPSSSTPYPTIDNLPFESVAHRVRHQRRLLAMRLGLSVMTDVIGDEDRSNSMIPVLTQDDLPMEQSGSDIRQQHSRRIHKANLQSESSAATGYDMDVQESLETEPQNPNSIRALLVREISSVQTDTSASNASRHRNPQLLLANELLYRMFDPIWYVRHGALLGILSLLRAWTKSCRSMSKLNHLESESAVVSNLFGIWPHDLLARCLCVLALDRFGDFAGGHINQGSDKVNGISLTLVSLGTSVVAPVREICGQIVAVLHSMAPSDVAEQSQQILFQLCQCEGSWEVRHGARIALKYIAVVETRDLLPDLSSTLKLSRRKKPLSSIEWTDVVRHFGVVGLSDVSDDVKSASTHLLLELCSGTTEENCYSILVAEFAMDVIPALWNALQSVRPVSSCIVDLVALLTLLVNRDCSLVLKSMSRNSSDICRSNPDEISSLQIHEMIQFLVKLLDSNFPSVRVSSLNAIGVVMSELSKSHSLVERWDYESVQLFSTTLQDVAAIILLLFRRSSDIESESEDFPTNILHSTWVHMSDACVKLLTKSQKEVLDVLLLSLYFQVDDEHVFDETNFSSRVKSANALAYYLSGSAKALDVSDLVQTALLVFLLSPSPLQCESACLLYTALATRLVRRSCLEAFENILDVDLALPCLVTARRGSTDNVAGSIAAVMAEKNSSYGLSDGHAHVWTKLLPVKQQCDALGSDGMMCPLNSMRVSAILAGAVLTKGLPAKLTPLIRAFVTFFNNECVSRSRAALVAKYITELLELLVSSSKFEKACRKILDTVCDAVTYRSCCGMYNEFRIFFASAILRSFVKHRNQMISFQDIPSFWMRLWPITIFSNTEVGSSACVLDAIDLLNVFIESLCDEHQCVRELVDVCTPRLIDLALTKIVTQERSILAIVALLKISPDRFLKAAVPLLKRELQNRNEDQRRFSSCKILQQLVEASDTKFSAFVRMLLPIVLSLMTDSLVDCAQCATATFALLVKIAPLVRPLSSEDPSISSEDHHESVIDHLIFGKPLPYFELPEKLSNSLRDKNIVLRNYQKEGVTWLRFLQSVNLSGALCDDMGTGKSIQALVAIACKHADVSQSMETNAPFRSLIVCPATLVGHWDGEISKCFAPQTIFTSLCLTGSRVERVQKWSSRSESVNIVIVSYSVLRSDVDFLESEKWCYCVLDEGHLLKNPKTATALASKRLIAQHKLVLTGTLIQNRIHELWATFDFLLPGFLGTSKAFTSNFANPISRSQLPTASASDIAIGIGKLKQLHQQVLPFILRREKYQVLSELPPMSQTVIHVPMSCIQKNIYKDFCTEKVSHKLIDEMEKSLSASNPFSVMCKDDVQSLLFLRLLCTHPALVLTKQQRAVCPSTYFTVNASGKMLALVDLMRTALQCDDDIFGADGDNSLLYEDNSSDDQEGLLSTLDTPDPWLGDLVLTEIDSRRTAAWQTSKCLIFAQFTRSLDVVEDVVLKTLMPSVRYVRLDGTVSADKRMNIVNLFQRDPNVKVLLLTTRVGGIGLNLTSANTVIFLEIDFNPYADFQAQDRCMRIGQTREVNVYRIVTQGSIEENILELQKKKVVVTEAIVNNDNSTLYSMGTDRLLDVFSIEDHNRDSASARGLKLEYDLEGIVEQCSIDYKNLSVDMFAKTFGNLSKSEISDHIDAQN